MSWRPIQIDRRIGSGSFALAPGPEWMSDPRLGCIRPNVEDPEIFTSDNLRELNTAKAICHARCPLIAECAAWADRNNERHHVWGGQIRTLKKTQRKSDAA
jgi:hypothetical protein